MLSTWTWTMRYIRELRSWLQLQLQPQPHADGIRIRIGPIQIPIPFHSVSKSSARILFSFVLFESKEAVSSFVGTALSAWSLELYATCRFLQVINRMACYAMGIYLKLSRIDQYMLSLHHTIYWIQFFY